jgi:hypothetical protein
MRAAQDESSPEQQVLRLACTSLPVLDWREAPALPHVR